MTVKKDEVVVTEDDIEEELKKTVERNSKLMNIEDRSVETGDTLNIDFEGSVDGVPFEG